MIQQLKDFVGTKVNGVSMNIDILNGCCLACDSCAIGSIGTKRKGIMTIEKFRQILDKAQREFKVRHVQLYMYSDPCMHRDLHLFVQECTDRGIPSWISTMLQVTNCDFSKVIEARPTEFRISMPGFDHMTRFQGGAKPEAFKKKFPVVCALPRHKETKWTLFYQSYRDNSHEDDVVEKLATDNGLTFVKVNAIFMPLEKYVNGDYSEKDRELMTHLWETPEQAAQTMKRTSTCGLWKQISIDANGDVFLCQLLYREEFKLVPFLDYPYSAIKKMITGHDFCQKCLKKGGNVLQNCYAEIATSKDPVGEANKKRRDW